jgi:antitoxin MazE
MAHLVKIGNSQGIRIPKPLIQQANFEGKELDIQVVKQGILVTPSKKPREGWKKAIETILARKGLEATDDEWLDATLTSDDAVEW